MNKEQNFDKQFPSMAMGRKERYHIQEHLKKKLNREPTPEEIYLALEEYLKRRKEKEIQK